MLPACTGAILSRTEGARIIEDSKHETMQEISKELPLLKVWRTMGDERVRSSHISMEGVTVKFDEDFTLPSGVKAPYPKQSGDPAEDINCRCYCEYKVDINNTEQEGSAKGLNKENRINTEIINSNKYDKKFNGIETNKDLQRTIKQKAREILQHRDGTLFEDLAYIDSDTNKALISKYYEVERTAKPTKAMNKMLRKAENYSIIALHNHPNSTPPSLEDIQVSINRKYKYGVVACHNGDLWKYSAMPDANSFGYHVALVNFEKSKYNNIEDFINEAKGEGVLLWKI